MYLEMAPVIQIYNTFRNRWCGAYFASKGMGVIPTVSWGDPEARAPNFEKPHINYSNGALEFKDFKGGIVVKNIIQCNSTEENRFVSLGDFEDCMIRGGEVEFVWKDKIYSITHTDSKISISEVFKQETERLYNIADEALEFKVDGVRLRDIITEVEVTNRTI